MIRTAYQPAGEFESSNDLLNRIYRTTAWTYENLTLGGYVVDCPTRERLGYGGDAGTSLETGMFNFDTAASTRSGSPTGATPSIPTATCPIPLPLIPSREAADPCGAASP